MTCSQVRENLQDRKSVLRSPAAWAHLVRCSHCRTEARTMRALRNALRDAGCVEAPADLLPAILAMPRRDAPAHVAKREGRKMRRLTYVGAAVLVIAISIGLLVPGQLSKPDAESILMGVAHAMEEAKSLHIVFHGTESGVKTPSGLRMMPGPMDLWLSSRAIYMRALAPDGTVIFAGAADADTREIWAYTRDEKTYLVGDLTPIADRAAGVISEASKLFRSDRIMQTIGKVFPDAKMSVATETREGRRVAVVTVTGTLKTSPRRVAGRNVFEVDAGTNRLLTMRQYAKAEGAQEQLVQTMDRVDYDVPMPAEGRTLEVPEGTKTVRATPTIEETERTLGLALKSGKHVLRYEVPRGDK